ncbi:MAG TPA: DUF2914 domain-containing protein [Bdellovibrionota bacterium]|nr:DUF2914 domain-containing protein [Bdellovibrionota bacterium]
MAKHERWWPIAFFLGGFLFDVVTLSRIDSVASILQQFVYLTIIALILGFEIIVAAGRPAPQGRIGRLWSYQEVAVHFMLGSLLSQYTLFFFKSSSLRTSFLFMAVLLALLVVNEFKRFSGSSGIPMRSGLFSLCLVSFFICIVPVALGTVGVLPFLLALAGAGLAAYGYTRWLGKRMGEKSTVLKKQFWRPFTLVTGTFALLYFTKLIPPVPLAVNYLGIFHDVRKEDGKYVLTYTRPGWKFWQNGDQTFLARPGDKVYAFAQVFSPGGFKDKIQVHWLLHHPKRGWEGTDAIPMTITGGRDEGFRGFAIKANYQPGEWQVRVETADDREIGRIYFTIENDSSSEERELRSISH